MNGIIRAMNTSRIYVGGGGKITLTLDRVDQEPLVLEYTQDEDTEIVDSLLELGDQIGVKNLIGMNVTIDRQSKEVTPG